MENYKFAYPINNSELAVLEAKKVMNDSLEEFGLYKVNIDVTNFIPNLDLQNHIEDKVYFTKDDFFILAEKNGFFKVKNDFNPILYTDVSEVKHHLPTDFVYDNLL